VTAPLALTGTEARTALAAAVALLVAGAAAARVARRRRPRGETR
jgi:hypothetical protein